MGLQRKYNVAFFLQFRSRLKKPHFLLKKPGFFGVKNSAQRANWVYTQANPANSTSHKTIECMRQWFAVYGLPKFIVSDNGPQFRSAEFETFLAKNGIKRILTPPHHSASNGMAECLVRSFKESLEKSEIQSSVH